MNIYFIQKKYTLFKSFFITLSKTKQIKNNYLLMPLNIPDINRPEWRRIITGEIEHKYINYVLQTNIHQLRREVSKNRKSIETAITEIYDLCFKYYIAVLPDLKQIFNF